MEASKPAWILIQNGIGLVLGFLTYLLIIRDAGLSTWGIFSFALSFGMVFSFVSDLGINTAHVRMIAAGKDRNEYNNALMLIKVLLTATFIGVIFLAIFIWTVGFHQKFGSPYDYLSILFLIPYFVGLPYIQANRAFFTGTQEAFKMSFPPIMESIVRFASVVILIHFNVFHFPSAGSGLLKMAILIAVSYSLSYAVYTILSFTVGMPWRFKWPHFETVKDYLRYSYPLMGVAIATAVATNLAQVLIYISIGPFQSGGYASDYRFILMMTGFTTSVTILILPTLTSMLGTNGDYGKSMGATIKYLTIFVTPLTIFVIVFATPILNLWSSALIQFGFGLQIMLIGSWFWTMSIPFWTHFNATAKTGISGILNIFGYASWIVLDVIFIPQVLADTRFAGLGVNGAAYAYMIAGVLLFVVSVAVLLKEVRIPVNFQAIKGVSISLLLGALLYYLLSGVHRMPALEIIGLFIGYIAVYIGLLIAVKALSKREFFEILNMLNLKRLLRYAINEIRTKSQ